jgi:hypothetical protein
MKRNPDGPLYLETAALSLRETSHLTSAPSSDYPTKIAASNTTVFLENESVKK